MSSFDKAIAAFDDYNAKDPNRDEGGVAKELLYAQRMSSCLSRFAPNAAEEVRLAARCQHIGRWQIPRNTYPEGRKGYLQWRNKLKEVHAQIAADLLRKSGYGDNMVEKIRFLLLKKDLQHNPNTQLLEDVVCLVFVEFYLADFAAKHESQKVVEILRKTLKKMSPLAKQAATQINLDDSARTLMNVAL
jgi:hypothetical protein